MIFWVKAGGPEKSNFYWSCSCPELFQEFGFEAEKSGDWNFSSAKDWQFLLQTNWTEKVFSLSEKQKEAILLPCDWNQWRIVYQKFGLPW